MFLAEEESGKEVVAITCEVWRFASSRRTRAVV